MKALYRGVMLGLRDYVQKNGFPGVVLGCPAGLTSALVAALAVDALGRSGAGGDDAICLYQPDQS